MTRGERHLYRRLRISGSFIIAGLVVEFLSLMRIHPLAFLSFMFIGGGFLLAGIGFYLYSIVGAAPAGEDHPR
jgi:hypothetical protein